MGESKTAFSRTQAIKLMDASSVCFNNRNKKVMHAGSLNDLSSVKINVLADELASNERQFKERMKNMSYMNTVRLFRTAD